MDIFNKRKKSTWFGARRGTSAVQFWSQKLWSNTPRGVHLTATLRIQSGGQSYTPPLRPSPLVWTWLRGHFPIPLVPIQFSRSPIIRRWTLTLKCFEQLKGIINLVLDTINKKCGVSLLLSPSSTNLNII